MDKRPIGVFDSGVGGLSILRELRQLLPNENYVFLADQQHLPYGGKSERQIIDYSRRATTYLARQNIKLLVIACNTVTCYAKDALREKCPFPIIGTVPALKPAAEQTRSDSIAVLSTRATARSKELKGLMRNFCQGVKVLNIGCPGLEKVVENGKLNSANTTFLLEQYLKKVKDSDVDYLVLGCTHYPFLKDAIREIAGPSIKILDSGAAIARRAKALLKLNRFKNTQEKRGKISYFTTGDRNKFNIAASRLLQTKVSSKKIKI